jgi:hypothetical protein
MLTDDELAALSPEERLDLTRRLGALDNLLPRETPTTRRRRLSVMGTMVAACLVLIPWIVFLAAELPRRYAARHWDVAWAGFDLLLLVGLALTAWTAWRRRQLMIVTAFVTATLLVCDAWFDVLTSATHSDQLLALVSAFLIELPLAILLFYVGRRALLLTVRAERELAGMHELDLPLWKTPLFGADAEESRADRERPASSASPR